MQIRNIRKITDKENIGRKCRLYSKREDCIKEYKNWKHDRVASVLHWGICKRYDCPSDENWYNHKVKEVLENENKDLVEL